MRKVTIFIFISIVIGLLNFTLIYYQPNFRFFGFGKKAQNKTASEVKGAIVFNTYCVLCHGEKGDGNGKLAVGKIPPPANLTKSLLNEEQLIEIIRNGGAGVGRSEFMPPWGDELTEGQIQSVIQYLYALRTN